MTREDAIKVLEMVEAHGLADEAKNMAISDMRKMSYITDRPCAVCKFNEDGNGCKKWTCVFEDGKENNG